MKSNYLRKWDVHFCSAFYGRYIMVTTSQINTTGTNNY